MKPVYSLIPLWGLLAIGAVIVSCSNSEARFAKEIPGVWQGTPENITDNSAITATIIDTYEFSPASMTANETLTGAVTVSGMINTTTQIVADSSLIEPVSLSTAARSSISGTWTVIDDDEIAIALDPESLMVEVDPDGVTASEGGFNKSWPAVDSLRPGLVKTITNGIRTALTTRYASMRHLEDVKVKGTLLKYELNDEDFVLTKQE